MYGDAVRLRTQHDRDLASPLSLQVVEHGITVGDASVDARIRTRSLGDPDRDDPYTTRREAPTVRIIDPGIDDDRAVDIEFVDMSGGRTGRDEDE
jgi:hypothetical protein